MCVRAIKTKHYSLQRVHIVDYNSGSYGDLCSKQLSSFLNLIWPMRQASKGPGTLATETNELHEAKYTAVPLSAGLSVLAKIAIILLFYVPWLPAADRRCQRLGDRLSLNRDSVLQRSHEFIREGSSWWTTSIIDHVAWSTPHFITFSWIFHPHVVSQTKQKNRNNKQNKKKPALLINHHSQWRRNEFESGGGTHSAQSAGKKCFGRAPPFFWLDKYN